jgi:hypothetical protein
MEPTTTAFARIAAPPPGRPKAGQPPRGAASTRSMEPTTTAFARIAAPPPGRPKAGQPPPGGSKHAQRGAHNDGLRKNSRPAAGPPQGGAAPPGGSKHAQRAQRGGTHFLPWVKPLFHPGLSRVRHGRTRWRPCATMGHAR